MCPQGCKLGVGDNQGGLPWKNGKALKALYFSCLNFEKGCD